ncbi:DUF2163 domain-containing protein [Rhodobacteraceae bacterium XHP0102]|nr:DUF2163 domain-containing protein [Rhodobacteraceae bacterium XHP0102]
MSGRDDFLSHLATGATQVARAWKIMRKDGVVLGFTDHDRNLHFDGVTFRADSGLSAGALAQETGLSVDNGFAIGALRDDVIAEADIARGLYDGAEVTAYLVRWDAPEARMVQFKGHMGEITRKAGQFEVELRGLSEALNQSRGRAYGRDCDAVLGDLRCRADLDAPSVRAEAPVRFVDQEARILRFETFEVLAFPLAHFERGTVEIAGARALIKLDQRFATYRQITLWSDLEADLGQNAILRAGCDKRWTTCRDKFDNLLNFQGFPDIPGEDWQMSYPARAEYRNGGSRR